jgi:hypothetical protein
MEVVGHQTIGKDPHGQPRASPVDELDKRLVVRLVPIDGDTTVAAVQDMIADAIRGRS